jgi:hypothetical protein
MAKQCKTDDLVEEFGKIRVKYNGKLILRK